MWPRRRIGEFRTMPRFVILEHDHPALHWDLMLETGQVLRTWRLETPPRDGETIRATAIFDHRLLYLDYEGPISGGRGRVACWERGTFTGEVEDKSPILVQLQGEHLQGVLRLEQIEGDSWRASVIKSEPEA
jgi:DNA polymerase Ligase (LigD)